MSELSENQVRAVVAVLRRALNLQRKKANADHAESFALIERLTGRQFTENGRRCTRIALEVRATFPREIADFELAGMLMDVGVVCQFSEDYYSPFYPFDRLAPVECRAAKTRCDM